MARRVSRGGQDMISSPGTASKVQNASRWAGWVLVILHGILALYIACNFRTKAVEWWPFYLFFLDFPASLVLTAIGRHLNPWQLWGGFLALGSAWHFYWPQGLVWLLRRVAKRMGR